MTTEPKPSKTSDIGQKLIWLAPRLAILALTSVGAYEVFRLLLWFLPWELAAVGASSFELTYIALVVTPFHDDKQKRNAELLSRVAVGVSVVYTFIAGYSHLDPFWKEWVVTGRDVFAIGFKLLITLLHAVPLATMSYSLSGLVLHGEKEDTSVLVLNEQENAMAGLIERLDAIEEYLRKPVAEPQENPLLNQLILQVQDLSHRLEITQPVTPLLSAKSITDWITEWRDEEWSEVDMILELQGMGYGDSSINQAFGKSNRWVQVTLKRHRERTEA